jgi:hypothetical protein
LKISIVEEREERERDLLHCKKTVEILTNANNDWNTNISFYLETSSGQNSNLYSNIVQFFNAGVNYTSVAA